MMAVRLSNQLFATSGRRRFTTATTAVIAAFSAIGMMTEIPVLMIIGGVWLAVAVVVGSKVLAEVLADNYRLSEQVTELAERTETIARQLDDVEVLGRDLHHRANEVSDLADKVEHHHHQLDHRANEIADAVGDIDRRVGQNEQQAAALFDVTSDLACRVDDESAAVAAAHAEFDHRIDLVQDRSDAVAETQHSSDGAISEQLRQAVDAAARHAAREHTQWVFSVARARAEHIVRDRVLLLLTIHRTGGTMLYDMLRTHPDVAVDPLATTWRSLGMNGLRYPSVLSDVPGATLEVEITDGIGALIPAMPRFDGWTSSAPWLIEKAHPHFAGFDADRFAARVDDLGAAGIDVQVVYVVRDPIDVMWSMHEYKTRDASWYDDLSSDEIPEFVARSFRTLAAMHERRGGRVVDYASHRNADGPIVDLAADLTSPRRTHDELVRWHRFACTATDRGQRQERVPGTFLGTPDPERSPEGPDSGWTRHRPAVDEASAIWTSLTGAGTTTG